MYCNQDDLPRVWSWKEGFFIIRAPPSLDQIPPAPHRYLMHAPNHPENPVTGTCLWALPATHRPYPLLSRSCTICLSARRYLEKTWHSQSDPSIQRLGNYWYLILLPSITCTFWHFLPQLRRMKWSTCRCTSRWDPDSLFHGATRVAP